MALETGSLLNNRYRILEVLGQGGMAAVYRAVDENLGVEVAVKENLFTSDEYARQFRLEATILAGLRQSNLPRVSDHFVIEPLGQYLVMDFIEGEDLRQRMDRLGLLPEEEVIIIGVAICDALIYMHSRKPMILHRDIKPGNVRITPHGHIFLVDFGLAKLVLGRETTNTGARAMTPGYSPPEQYGSSRTDARSDIYSLGATLYSALTGSLPEDALERLMKRKELTSIQKHNPQVSDHLAEIIERCLALQVEDRFQTADELKYALLQARSISRRKLPIELVLQPPPITLHGNLPGETNEGGGKQQAKLEPLSPAKNKKSTRPLPQAGEDIDLTSQKIRVPRNAYTWILLVLLPVLVLSGFGIYAARPDILHSMVSFFAPGVVPTSTQTAVTSGFTQVMSTATSTTTPVPTVTSPPTTTSTPKPSLTSTATHHPTNTPTVLPTPLGGANQIAFASTRSGAVEIWLMTMDGRAFEQVTNIPEGACQPRWSPDGKRIAFISPCERHLTSYPGASIFLINADGSGLTPLPTVPGGDYDPSWSPDGTRIAFTSLRKGGVPGIYVINLGDNNVRSLVENETWAISQPAWSPDGKLIAYVNTDNRIWVMDVNGENRRDLTIGGGDYLINGPAWSPDGSVVIYTRTLFSDSTGATRLMGVQYFDTGAIPFEVPNSDLVSDVSFSFDGYWLLFTSWFSGNHDICIMRANGVDRHPIDDSPAYDFDPVWRPGYLNRP